MQPPTWIVSGSIDISTELITPGDDEEPGLLVGVAGTATIGIALMSPVVVAKPAEIQQKVPAALTCNHVPPGFFPTISTLWPGLKTVITGQLVSGPERQLRG